MTLFDVISIMMPTLLVNSIFLGSFLPVDSILSTQGIMVMLLGAYAVAMWMFLTSAPKVHTIMVSDLAAAREFYEGLLDLPVAEVPLHYYYNYEQSLGTPGVDPIYLSNYPSPKSQLRTEFNSTDGLWYQLKKDTQVHIVTGANFGHNNRHRHVCFDHACLETILLRVQARRLKYKIRRNKPLNFLVKDLEERVIELAESNE